MLVYQRVMWVKQCHKPSPKSPWIDINRWYEAFPNGWFIIGLTPLCECKSARGLIRNVVDPFLQDPLSLWFESLLKTRVSCTRSLGWDVCLPATTSNHDPLHWGLLCRALGWPKCVCWSHRRDSNSWNPTALEDRLKHNALYIACANGANSGGAITSYGPMVNVTTQKGPVVVSLQLCL